MIVSTTGCDSISSAKYTIHTKYTMMEKEERMVHEILMSSIMSIIMKVCGFV